MKMLLVAFLALSLAAVGTAPSPSPGTSTPLGSDDLAAIAGTGFWGGLACGAAVAGAAFGTIAIVGVVGAGTTIGLGAAFAYAVAVEGSALCMMLE